MRHGRSQARRGELLVGVINRKRDFALLREQGWYRIPIASAPRR